MAKGKRRRKVGSKQAETQEQATGAKAALDRVTLVLTLVGVSVFAIFTGYLVGQYAVRWVASPLVVTERAVDPGTRVVDDSGSTTSPVALPPAASATAARGSPSTQAPPATAQATAGGAPGAPQTRPATSTSQPAATAQGETTIYRVHVGRFSTREDATRLAEALKTSSPAIPDAWVLLDHATGQYRVQAGAFSNRQRAQDLVDQLRAAGHDAFVTP